MTDGPGERASEALASTEARTTTARRSVVRVSFWAHVIATHVAEPALARRYADAMARRFYGLRTTTEELANSDDGPFRELPAEPFGR
jgi:hypothetical protein